MSSLVDITNERNEMREKLRNPIDDLQVPYAVAKRWIKTEQRYQIKLANMEASRLQGIIKEQAKEIEDLKRGIKR